MGKLDGKIAFITGGSIGIGLATAHRFFDESATHVFITGRRQEAPDAAVKKLDGKNVTAVQGDTSNLADLDKVYSVIKADKDHLDILFANAGDGKFAPLDSITAEYFDKTFNTNVNDVLFTVQKALPIFKNWDSRFERTEDPSQCLKFLDTLAVAAPMNRIGTADEIAKVAVFLADNELVHTDHVNQEKYIIDRFSSSSQ